MWRCRETKQKTLEEIAAAFGDRLVLAEGQNADLGDVDKMRQIGSASNIEHVNLAKKSGV